MTSGSRHTAEAALALDRTVMAVPGPVGSAGSEGCHQLLREGAELAAHVDDVFEALQRSRRWVSRRLALTATEPSPAPPESPVLSVLQIEEPRHVEEIALELGREITAVLAELADLKLAGWVREHPGQFFQRALTQASKQ